MSAALRCHGAGFAIVQVRPQLGFERLMAILTNGSDQSSGVRK